MVEDAWLGLAELKLAQGYRHEAIAIYREAAGHLPDSSVPYHLARLMVTEHDLEEILSEEDAEMLYHLGTALSEAGKYDQATLVFKRIIEMQPQTVEQWTDLARYYIYLEDYDSATALLSQAAEAMPDSSEIYLYWGTALESTERYDEAIAVYQRGLEHLPDAVELYLYWGLAQNNKTHGKRPLASIAKHWPYPRVKPRCTCGGASVWGGRSSGKTRWPNTKQRPRLTPCTARPFCTGASR